MQGKNGDIDSRILLFVLCCVVLSLPLPCRPNSIDKIFKPLRAIGVFKDAARDYRESALESYAERGKALTQKGNGKRAQGQKTKKKKK